MGKGIDLARPDAPEHAALLDDLKDQLLIAFMRRLGGDVAMPVTEVDATGSFVLEFSLSFDAVEGGMFCFHLRGKS